MKKYLKILAVISLFGVTQAMAGTNMPINPLLNCFDTTNLTATGVASFQLAPGKYVVSIKNNTMSCSNNILSGGCLIDSIVMQVGLNQARWGLSVKSTPTVLYKTATCYRFVKHRLCINNRTYQK